MNLFARLRVYIVDGIGIARFFVGEGNNVLLSVAFKNNGARRSIYIGICTAICSIKSPCACKISFCTRMGGGGDNLAVVSLVNNGVRNGRVVFLPQRVKGDVFCYACRKTVFRGVIVGINNPPGKGIAIAYGVFRLGGRIAVGQRLSCNGDPPSESKVTVTVLGIHLAYSLMFAAGMVICVTGEPRVSALSYQPAKVYPGPGGRSRGLAPSVSALKDCSYK